MDLIEIFQDGACWNKEGKSQFMGVGVAVFINKEYEPALSRAVHKVDLLCGSNNVAEWIACQMAMEIAVDLRKSYPKAKIEVYSDSQIIVNQFYGTYTINNMAFKPYHEKATYAGNKARVTLSWIPREQNTKADELSKIGLHGFRPDSPHYKKYSVFV